MTVGGPESRVEEREPISIHFVYYSKIAMTYYALQTLKVSQKVS